MSWITSVGPPGSPDRQQGAEIPDMKLAATAQGSAPAGTGSSAARPGKPVLLIYSNCQGDHIAKLLSRMDCLADEIAVKYLFIHSLEEPGQGWDSYPDDYMDSVTCVWEQVSEAFPVVRAEFHRRLPAGVRRIRFPAFTAGMIWPFAGPDPRPSKRCLYLYGDSVAARIGMRFAGKRITDDEIFAEYMEVSSRRMPDLDRRLELETWAWRKRDLESDISAADYLLANFRTTQLFYEPARITQHLLRYTALALIGETFDARWSKHAQIMASARQLLRYHVGYDTISQPVHPLVAETLKLEWYDPDATYRWFMHDWTFREWVVRCVRLTPYIATLF
jgi:hypothetical protein